MLTHEEAMNRLRTAVSAYPSQAAFARAHGLHPGRVSRVFARQQIPDRLAATVGLKPLENGFRGVPRHRQPKRFYVELGQ